MDEAYIGSIVLFAGNFAPRGWAFCDGSLLSLAQNQALFAILGTTYGGNGQTTFALPDLRGRVPAHANNGQAGPGVNAIQLGEKAGTNTTTLTVANMPMHTHGQQFMSGAATASAPASGLSVAQANGTVTDSGDATTTNIYGSAGTPVPGGQTSPAGGSQPLGLMQPYLGLNYIICLQGLFPSRN